MASTPGPKELRKCKLCNGDERNAAAVQRYERVSRQRGAADHESSRRPDGSEVDLQAESLSRGDSGGSRKLDGGSRDPPEGFRRGVAAQKKPSEDTVAILPGGIRERTASANASISLINEFDSVPLDRSISRSISEHGLPENRSGFV